MEYTTFFLRHKLGLVADLHDSHSLVHSIFSFGGANTRDDGLPLTKWIFTFGIPDLRMTESARRLSSSFIKGTFK